MIVELESLQEEKLHQLEEEIKHLKSKNSVSSLKYKN